MTDATDKSRLTQEVGGLIINDPAYADGNWRAISLVFTVQPGVVSLDGFIYRDGEKPQSYLPQDDDGEIEDAAIRLRETMEADSGKPWKQMLYQIWFPGPDFRASFEYDRPDRWSLTGYSEDGVASFAEQVDPARGAQ